MILALTSFTFSIKSCASDPVPASLMKENLDVFLPEICHLVNLSLSTGNMDGVKSALLVPLLKNASLDSSSLKSYRLGLCPILLSLER